MRLSASKAKPDLMCNTPACVRKTFLRKLADRGETLPDFRQILSS